MLFEHLQQPPSIVPSLPLTLPTSNALGGSLANRDVGMRADSQHAVVWEERVKRRRQKKGRVHPVDE